MGGDLIVAIDGQQVSDSQQVDAIMEKHQAGDTVSVTSVSYTHLDVYKRQVVSPVTQLGRDPGKEKNEEQRTVSARTRQISKDRW